MLPQDLENCNRQDHLNIYIKCSSQGIHDFQTSLQMQPNIILLFKLHHPTTEHKKESMYTKKKKKKHSLEPIDARYIMTLCSLIGESVIK
jgi:hypothetical protein